MVLALETIGRAQVDSSSGKARTNIDLPRGAFDLQPKTQDVVVPPAWRDVERDSAAGFRPGVEVVSSRGAAALVTKQLGAFLAAERAIDEGHGDPAITMSRDPAAELRRRFEEEPQEWVRAEIQVEVEGSGQVASVAVVGSSGRRELDRQALAAVKLAATKLRGKRGATVRFACDAGVVATPPLMGIAQGDPRNHGIAAGMRIHFDENTRKIEPVIPFVRRVVTKVQIIDYSEAR
jgi:TonB family protein